VNGKYILDDKGEPHKEKNLMKWAKWYENSGQARIVAKTCVGNAEVSTVFLSLDHSFGNGPPMLYETMIFNSEDNEFGSYLERYSTRAEAEAGHTRIVNMVSHKE